MFCQPLKKKGRREGGKEGVKEREQERRKKATRKGRRGEGGKGPFGVLALLSDVASRSLDTKPSP